MPAVRKDTFTDLQWQIVCGSVLGDGSLGKPSSGVNYHLTVSHGPRQVQYLRWKHSILSPLASPPTSYRRLDPRYGVTYEMWRFHTPSLPSLTALHALCYGEQRRIPSQVLDQMGSLAVAIWYMDDGGISAKGTPSIATVRYPVEDLGRACDWFLARWGIRAHVSSERRIFFDGQTRERFAELVEPHLPTDMRYKLPPPLRGKIWRGERDTGGRFLKRGGDTSDARLGGTNLRD